ncbi:MAG: type IV pilus assembly protein PilM [Patescibacteria group bacterium]
MGLFSSSDNSYLGVDIGDSSLKLVELKKKGKKIYLSNYAFSENVSDIKFTKIDDTVYLAKAINKVCKESNIKAKRVTASLPTFAVFSSIINLNNVEKKNMAEAVADEARKVIPLPLEEMKIDFKIMPAIAGADRANSRVFLTGSPKKLVRKYIDIFKAADLELLNLETETFSLVRSLLGSDKSTVMIVEIGANSTDISIIKESIPVLNRSLEICGNTITKDLATAMGLDAVQAEQFKIDLSISEKGNGELLPIIVKTIAPIVSEIEYMLDFFNMSNQGKVEKIILSGGGSMLTGLPEYLSDKLNLQVIVGDPFSRVVYAEELRPVINEVGPKLAVAVGLALRDIEN